jgi:hypothetical protein
MAFDIYGNHLRPGYCEVHPDVHESYPCRYCYEEQEYQYYDDPRNDEYAEFYYNEMYRDIYMRFECRDMWE